MYKYNNLKKRYTVCLTDLNNSVIYYVNYRLRLLLEIDNSIFIPRNSKKQMDFVALIVELEAKRKV